MKLFSSIFLNISFFMIVFVFYPSAWRYVNSTANLLTSLEYFRFDLIKGWTFLFERVFFGKNLVNFEDMEFTSMGVSFHFLAQSITSLLFNRKRIPNRMIRSKTRFWILLSISIGNLESRIGKASSFLLFSRCLWFESS